MSSPEKANDNIPYVGTTKPERSDLNESDHQLVDAISERKLLRKLDLTLLPALTLLYLLSFLDRSNVGNARIEGLTKDLHMTGDQYLTGLTLYFIGYVLVSFTTSKSRRCVPRSLASYSQHSQSCICTWTPTKAFTVRGSLQPHLEAMETPSMAAFPHSGLGSRFNAHGCHSIPSWILRR